MEVFQQGSSYLARTGGTDRIVISNISSSTTVKTEVILHSSGSFLRGQGLMTRSSSIQLHGVWTRSVCWRWKSQGMGGIGWRGRRMWSRRGYFHWSTVGRRARCIMLKRSFTQAVI